jgi:AbrB family looped-hinge helix DNA binding protein
MSENGENAEITEYTENYKYSEAIPLIVVNMSKGDPESCCGPDGRPTGLCNLEALVNVDDRGQILLPKDLREKAKIGPGDKLAVVTCEEDGEVTVIALIKSNNIAGMINDFIMPKLGPLG